MRAPAPAPGCLMFRVFGGTVACAILLAGPAGAAAEVADPFPRMAASYIVRLNGETLWAHEPDRPLPPASLTKIMTALLAIESGRLDEIATVTEAAARATGSRLGLAPGDRMRIEDLVAATMLGSANDAARALAEHLAGSEAGFVQLMNRRARELGMRKTRFANAAGHDHPDLKATAADLARLAAAALSHERFSRLVAEIHREVRTADGKRVFRLENRNELVGRYRGAVGVKSGHTGGAGPCLIAVARRDGDRVLLVLLNARNRWWDAEAVMDRAFLEARRNRKGDRP
jgi:serine-type D-Ala-D-Ala carboxypeptidase (penicillin-binding protein 5/6)